MSEVRYFIGYLSTDATIMFGVSAPSYVEALSVLADDFGDEVVAYYEDARQELGHLAEAGDPPHVTAPILEGGSVTATGGSATEGQAGGDRVGGGLAVFQTATLEDDDESDASTSETPSNMKTCDICGTEVTPDRAVVSQLQYGEDRCADCSG